jgi:hypothetical protein
MSGRDVPHVAAIFSLIQKEARGIPHPEVHPEPQMPLRGDYLQIFARIAKYETRAFALFTFSRDEPCENAPELESDRAGPRLQFCDKSLAGQHSFERDEDVAPETFHPAILHRAEPVGIGSLCLKIPKQRWIDPTKSHFLLPPPTAYFESPSRNGSVAARARVATLPHRRCIVVCTTAAAGLTYATNYCSRSGEHFQSRSWL